MSILRTGFAHRETLAAAPRPLLSVAVAAVVLSGCASPHPAPIVHRAPPGAVASAPTPPAAPPLVAPPPVAPPAGVGGPAPGASDPASGVQTTPIARGTVESRPLPGTTASPGAVASNLLKTEPKALKQPYSEATFTQMRAAAPAPEMPPVASAAPNVAAQSPSKTPVPDVPPSAAPAASGEWIWPAPGQVVQTFSQPRSMGIAIAGKPGDPIVAVNDGRVIFSGAGPRSYGNLVIVKHADETLSVYAHNRALLVKEGQSVQRGQRIAELGSSGTDSPKLHFEIRKDGRPIDPRKVLPAR